MNAKLEITRPVLVHYARYRWDKIREQHQIVYPEGVLVLNDTSAAILKCCDGRTIDELVAELAMAYDHDPADIAADVGEFLDSLTERSLLRNADERA